MVNKPIENSTVITDLQCYHCGQPCEEILWFEEKPFCCYGCQTVFEILQTNDLCEYYNLESRTGISVDAVKNELYDYLDEPSIRRKILTFDSDTFAKVSFTIPAIHCISCIWLLENLQRIQVGIVRSEVNFTRKTVAVDFDPTTISLSAVVNLLASLGYVPKITLDTDESRKPAADQSLILKLSIAGFCFGNVMLFSFPEYLGIDQHDLQLMRLFSWLNVILSLPVFFFSALDYFRSAVKSFRQRQINIDVPIAAGLLALFLRSLYDIVTTTGPGYLDSFTGLVFFLLIGRWFQSKTYESLSFDRDFKSYFPLAVQRKVAVEWKPVVVYELMVGDIIRIRNMEIIPADCTLLGEHAYIDYSFVTGEAKPVKAKKGELIYAGGRLIGEPVTFKVEKRTSQSQLTSLWNNEAFRKVTHSQYQLIIDHAARNFTWIVLGIALITAIYWQATQPAEMWLVLTSVLMVACPCALALAAPFTYGSMLRVFGRNHFYLKNADVIERLAAVNAVVFDKTGTVTHGQKPDVFFLGLLSPEELRGVKLLTSSSTHPLSEAVTNAINVAPADKVTGFKELPGRGIEGVIGARTYRVGSAEFVGSLQSTDHDASTVFVSIDDKIKGHFRVQVAVRKNIKGMLDRLGKKCVALLSGDNESDRKSMASVFNLSVTLLFNQSPHDKLAFVRNLQLRGGKVLMVGDGLNDSGALKQSDVGIAITDNTGVFTPACDGILQGDRINSMDVFMDLAKSSTTILKAAFVISFLYNAIALTFAVTGNLTPLIAAILMPMSSISVVGFSSLAVNYVANKKLGLWK